MWLLHALGAGDGAPAAASTSSCEADLSSKFASVRQWLDSVKPGYGQRFTEAFDAVGIEDTDDFLNLDDSLFEELETALRECGAKVMHMSNIQRALLEHVAASGQSELTWEPWCAEPTWKCEQCDYFGTYEEVAEHEETCPAVSAHHAAMGAAAVAGVASVGSSENPFALPPARAQRPARGKSASARTPPPKPPKPPPPRSPSPAPKQKPPSPSAQFAAHAPQPKKAPLPTAARAVATPSSTAPIGASAQAPSPPRRPPLPKPAAMPPAKPKRAASARAPSDKVPLAL